MTTPDLPRSAISTTTSPLPQTSSSPRWRRRSIRYYTDEPVDDRIIERLVYAATRASSGRNSQPWTFVALRDRAALQRLADEFSPRIVELHQLAERTDGPDRRRMFNGAAALMEAFSFIPVVIVVAGRVIDWGPPFDARETLHSALFSASQNLLVAARAHGLGAAFTTLHLHVEVPCEVTGLPDDLVIATTIPVGHPRRGVGPVRRKPVADVLHWDRYGT